MVNFEKKPVQIIQDEAHPVAANLAGISDAKLIHEVEQVQINLAKDDLAGIRARVIVLLDFSGSMSADYTNGNVAELLRRALAFGLNVDTDGQIEVFRFASGVDTNPYVVTPRNYDRAAADLSRGRMGSTNLTEALRRVRMIAENTDEVIYVFVLTDGNPDRPDTAAAEYAALANHAVFIKNIAIREVPFLSMVDTFNAASAPPALQALASRVVDNCNTQFFPDPAAVTPEEFATAATVEWRDWFIAAQHAGILV